MLLRDSAGDGTDATRDTPPAVQITLSSRQLVRTPQVLDAPVVQPAVRSDELEDHREGVVVETAQRVARQHRGRVRRGRGTVQGVL